MFFEIMVTRRSLAAGLGGFLLSGAASSGAHFRRVGPTLPECSPCALPLRLAASETRVGGRVLHVAPHGKDEDGPARGTFEHPFATLPHAYARAAAGDTILMRGGTYGFEGAQSGWILAGGGGTPGAPVKIVSYPGQTPIIDGARCQVRPSLITPAMTRNARMAEQARPT